MIEAINTENAIRERKCQDALKLCGLGMIVFAFWAVAKFIMELLTQGSSVLGDTSDISQGIIIFALVITFGLIAIDFLLRISVARAVGRLANGQDSGNKFLVMTVILLVINVTFLILGFNSDLLDGFTANDVMEYFIDIVDDLIMAAVLILTFQYRRFVKLSEKEV